MFNFKLFSYYNGPLDLDNVPSVSYSNVNQVSDGLFNFRFSGINFQTSHMRACSDWVNYFSNFSEIWSFFLFFYILALFFFFFYIIPEAYGRYRLALNSATPKSWLSGMIACGVPFVLIFSILYESVYMLFTNEVTSSKMLPLFLIEGKQWKWEYRYNLMGILEQLSAYKILGLAQEASTYKLSLIETTLLNKSITYLNGRDACESNLRIKSELLKSSKTSASLYDNNLAFSLNFIKNNLFYKELMGLVDFSFTKFRVTEGTRRIVVATKSIILGDSPVVKAHITSTDVIHSWTIPTLGIRIDAVPGKMYLIKIPFKFFGTFTGQCSEVCGLRHAYMPISLNFTSFFFFLKFVYLQLFLTVDSIFKLFVYKVL